MEMITITGKDKTVTLASKKKPPRRPANRHELAIKLVPTVTGGLELFFRDSRTMKKGGKRRKETEDTSDTFATVSAAVTAIDLRVADFVDQIKKEDTELGPLFALQEDAVPKKKKGGKK